jgi:hypothetical protein
LFHEEIDERERERYELLKVFASLIDSRFFLKRSYSGGLEEWGWSSIGLLKKSRKDLP